MFHRISNAFDPLQLSISPERVDLICKHLNEKKMLVSLSSGLDNLKRHQRGCFYAITFDDGYHDNIYLKRLALQGHKFTIYIATRLLGAQVLWPFQLINAIEKCNKKQLDLTCLDLGLFDLTQKEQRYDLILFLNDWLKQFSYQEMAEKLNIIMEKCQAPPLIDSERMLSPSEVADLHNAGVDIGAHTMNHVILSKLPYDDQEKEIRGCFADIKALLNNKDVLHFAYPNGRQEDFNDETVMLVREAGFVSAVTTIYGANRKNVDHFRLKRIAVTPNSFLSPWGTFSKSRFFSETSGLLSLIKEFFTK